MLRAAPAIVALRRFVLWPVAVLVLLFAASATRAAPCICEAGEVLAAKGWERPPEPAVLMIPLVFNATMAAALESNLEPGGTYADVGGNAATRWAVLQAVVADWNAALVNHRVQLSIVEDATKWSADQAGNTCADPLIAGSSVFDAPAYTHIGDLTHTIATGHDHLMDGRGPGWVGRIDIQDTFHVDRLAECKPGPRDANGFITTADITWMTHFVGPGVCDHIPWSYTAGAPGGGRFDFRSVLTHEIGHLLGLAHNDGDFVVAGDGLACMQPFVQPGTRHGIGVNEKQCLGVLYPIAALGEDPCPTAVPAVAAPATLQLECVPNPFARTSTIRFSVPQAGPVTLDVLDVSGARVLRLVDGAMGAGPHAVSWNGRGAAGREVAAGVFFVRLISPGYSATERLVMVR